MSRFYPKQYYELPRSLDELDSTAHALQEWKIELVKRFATSGRLLEIGPAYGLFAHLARKTGFDVTTIEMDRRCCSFLRDVVGVQVVEGVDTVGLLEKQEFFDVIVMWQVIEHLPDPWTVLTKAVERLAPGGILVVDTPNPSAFQFRVFGRNWTHVDAPRHLVLIPADVLVKHVLDESMTLLEISAVGEGSIGFNSFGWAFSLKNFFSGRVSAALAHFVGRVAAKLFIPIERTGFRGSTYSAVFRKEHSS